LLSSLCVVRGPLVAGGLTFGPVLRMLGLRDDRAGRLRARGEARVAATEAALRQLDDMAEDGCDAGVLPTARAGGCVRRGWPGGGGRPPGGGGAGGRGGCACWTGPTSARRTASDRRRRW